MDKPPIDFDEPELPYDVLAQRDELLEALRMVMACAGDISAAPDGLLEMALDDGDEETRRQANAFLVARAAIAKVEGTPSALPPLYTAPQPAAAVSVKPVAWVDVADAEHGPYEFHGIEKLPAGKHHLFAAPPAPSNGRTA